MLVKELLLVLLLAGYIIWSIYEIQRWIFRQSFNWLMKFSPSFSLWFIGSLAFIVIWIVIYCLQGNNFYNLMNTKIF